MRIPGSVTLKFRKPTSQRESAFTILEVLVTVGIVALLLLLTVQISSVFRERAKKVKCISHMKAIHAGLSGYHSDVGHWPQMEDDGEEIDEEDFFDFWVTVTEPYGLTQETWICPSDDAADHALRGTGDAVPAAFSGSYMVTQFDDRAQTPFRWNQPWAIERGNFHGKGAHILMPDGSVNESQNPFYGR